MLPGNWTQQHLKLGMDSNFKLKSKYGLASKANLQI